MGAWFDSHCHLYELDDPDRAVADAAASGVEGILALGVDQPTARRALALAAAHDGVWAGVGIHPGEARGWEPSWAEPIDALLDDPQVVAVGETGIDLYWDRSFVDDQKEAFAAQVDLAKRHDKALVVHTRSSIEVALDVLARSGPPERLIFHCWSAERTHLDEALRMGAYVGFAGNVSFKNADALRVLAAVVPEDRLLVETDAPYLAPEPKRGTANAPANVVLVGSAVARARGVEPDELAASTSSNARVVLGIGR